MSVSLSSESTSVLASPVSSISSLPADTASTAKRHDGLYLDIVVFQVGETLFRVPAYGLPGTTAEFKAMFPSSEVAAGDIAPGASDSNPIRVGQGVTDFEFASLLKAAYPLPERKSSVALTSDEWMAALKLSNLWGIQHIQKEAEKISKERVRRMSHVNKLLFAKKHGVAKWRWEAYKDIGAQREVISKAEKELLDMETYVGLLELRDLVWEKTTQSSALWNDVNSRKKTFDFDTAIRDIFKEGPTVAPGSTDFL